MAGCPVADVAAAIDELALLHGPRWGDESLTEIGWLHRNQPQQVEGIIGLITYAVDPFKEHYTERLDADTVELVDRCAAARRLPAPAPRPWTIVHGDFRADNLLFGGERVVVVDWQTVGLGPGASDLSYLLGASLTPAARQATESGSSTATSRARGPRRRPRPGRRLGAATAATPFGGLIMAIVASALVRRTDRGDEMFVTMAERHARQALDLDAESSSPRKGHPCPG